MGRYNAMSLEQLEAEATRPLAEPFAGAGGGQMPAEVISILRKHGVKDPEAVVGELESAGLLAPYDEGGDLEDQGMKADEEEPGAEVEPPYKSGDMGAARDHNLDLLFGEGDGGEPKKPPPKKAPPKGTKKEAEV